MIFDWNRCCALADVRELQGETGLTLPGGLWIGLLSSGSCTVQAPGDPAGAGAALGHSGDVLLGQGPLLLTPLAPCHLLAARLAGLAAEEFSRGLPAPRFADSAACPNAAELLAHLCGAGRSGADASRTAYALLCELAHADEAVQPFSPLVAQAVAAIRDHYMGLYGVEELSEQLGVSKCHLIRVFSAETGMPPGRFLIKTRIEAAKLLLAEENYGLDLVASLCGFSGANYFCRVFRRETGLSPAAWRAANAPTAPARGLPRQAQEMFV